MGGDESGDPARRAAGIAYEAHGDGPTVVCLHGIGDSRRTWAPVVELLPGTDGSSSWTCPATGTPRCPTGPPPPG
jgi:pimeloyl-ACP methyl ester carboxylesterase